MQDLFVEGLRILQHLEPTPDGEAQIEADWLFFPEVKSLGSNPRSLVRHQERLILSILENAEPDELSRRILPETEIVEGSISVSLECPRELPFWGEPIELRFPYLTWEDNSRQVAFVPCLGIEVILDRDREWEEELDYQIRFAINRRRINRRLFDLSLLQRCRRLELDRLKWNAYPLSPRERIMREQKDEDAVKPVLGEVGKRIDKLSPVPLFERESEIRHLVASLRGKRSVSSLLLVGESGVGKTALVYNLAARQGELDLPGKPVFHTPGSKIVAGMCGFGEWQERCRRMAVEASAGKGKILYFGNLMELLEVGQSSASAESIASFFRPWLIRGQFTAIAECTPAQLSSIEQKNPRMLEAFRQIKIDPPERMTALRILKAVVAGKPRIRMSEAACKRVLALHQRYAGYSALPGRMLQFTERLIQQARIGQAEGELRIPPSSVNLAFAGETGLPGFLLDDAVPFDVDEATTWFRQRIKGQDEAIGHVVGTIATIKARLTRANRPLGSFLFVGPTGVGKTELAKSLAEYFYGSRERMLRIDMSEYSAPGSAGRLASGGPGEPEGILTSKMRDQPFSIVLLDEFEKADDSVFDLFLQVLGEARLTDGAGRLADFSNAMIILTSNLGAAEFSAVAPGFGSPDRGAAHLAQDHFTEAARKKFRPEFFNRIGRIVPFMPLSDATVREVIAREVAKLDQRDGFRSRDLTIQVAEELIDCLARGDYDPRYGARPIKRTIEARLLKPVGQYLIRHPDVRRGIIEMTSMAEDGRVEFAFHSQDADLQRADRSRLKAWNERIPNIRRWFQILGDSHLVSELHSEVRRLERRIERDPGSRDHHRLAASRELINRLEDGSREILQVEETLMIASFENTPFDDLEQAVQSAPQWSEFCDLLRDLYLWIRQSASRMTLILVADRADTLARFAAAYRDVARDYGCRIKLGYFRDPAGPEDQKPDLPDHRRAVMLSSRDEVDSFLSGNLPDGCVALGMEISAPQIALRFSLEFGIHQFIDKKEEKSHVNLIGFDDEFSIEEGYVPDETLLDRNFRNRRTRRTWDEKKGVMKDEIWGDSQKSDLVDPRDLPDRFSRDAVHGLIELTIVNQALDSIRK